MYTASLTATLLIVGVTSAVDSSGLTVAVDYTPIAPSNSISVDYSTIQKPVSYSMDTVWEKAVVQEKKVTPKITNERKTETVYYRPPVGHTHTCPYDGTTWDHKSNPGHNCPTCGREQLIVDNTYKLVPDRTTSSISNVPVSAPVYNIPVYTQPYYTFPYNGCPNGNCPLPTTVRRW